MSALVKKEIRLLLPSFATALLLTFSVWLVPLDASRASSWREALSIFPFLLCPAMLVMTALDSFGREVSSGTFANLLAQPISRPRIWGTKTVLLAAALGIIFCSWWLSYFFHAPSGPTKPELQDLAFVTSLFTLAVFAGGQWTVLLFRQVAAAFWVTLIVPGALAMAVVGLTAKHPERAGPVMAVVFAIYILAGVLLSRRLFLRAQDVSWTGGTISMPEVRGLRGWFAERVSHRRQRPCAALFAKEFQLHQSLLVVAGVLVLLHLALIVTRPAGGGFHESPAFEFVAYQFWVLWPVMMPLLIGCAAVAEERKLGTLEGQLCLPVRRRTQFAIKFAVALGLVVLLGVLVPVLLEGRRILPDLSVNFSSELLDFYASMPHGKLVVTTLRAVEALSPWLPLLPMLLVAITLVAVSFYASTLVRNTLQTFAPAVLGILLAGSLLGNALWIGDAFHLWEGWLIYLIGVPALTLTLAGLAYWNFKRVLVGWPVWRRNLFAFLAVLAAVVVLTSLIYHRVWELLTPMEPAHGPARLAQAQGVLMRSDFANLIVQLPGGRIWTDRYLPTVPSLGAMLTGDWKTAELFPGGRFLDGTNWASIAMFLNRDVAAVQRDGSLWVSAQHEALSQYWGQRSGTNSEPFKLVRLGSGNDWKSVAGIFALKTDGTLWGLGGGPMKVRTNWQGFRAFEPMRLGADSDWAELASSSWLSQIIFRKTDGRAWINFGPSADYKVETLRFDEKTTLTRSSLHDGVGWRGLAWVYLPQGNSCQVGVRTDGTFRVCMVWRLPAGKTSGPNELTKFDLQLGKASDWRAIAGDDGTVVTLKADGSLWQWDFPVDPTTRPDTASATRLGTHSDWRAVVSAPNGIISLADDGSLWLWHIGRRDFSPSQHAIQPLLAFSRKPQSIGNIFGKAE